MVVRAPDRENRQALIEAAFAAAQKAEALNKQLLAFARRAPIAAEETDVGEALETLAPLLAKAVGEAVDVKVSHHGDCHRVRVESAQFEAAILNLCLNARDAMPRGGAIEVAARPATADELALAEVQEPAVTVAVRDNGDGIPPEILPRVFDPFFTTKDAGRGTGLGLSQVYGFARQSGGVVEATSTLGEGATFKIILPCTRGDERPRNGRPVSPRPWCTARSALLVEDDKSVSGVTTAMLTELGVEEIIALADGPSAQRLLQERGFDLLVTDVIMPGGLNGVELAEWAQARRPGMKVLLFSGWTADALANARTELPILQKPFDLEALRAAIERLG
jgi:CheY-like chemotaxis protein